MSRCSPVMRRFVAVDESWAQLVLSTIHAARARAATCAQGTIAWFGIDASSVATVTFERVERAPLPPARACALFALSLAIACVSEGVLRARVARAQRVSGGHGA